MKWYITQQLLVLQQNRAKPFCQILYMFPLCVYCAIGL